MMKEISVSCTQMNASTADAVLIRYSIEKEDNAITLSCAVASTHPDAASWLRQCKFNMKAVRTGKAYTAIFDNNAFDRSLNMSLLIDSAYVAIMKKEKLPLSAD
jgi:hypothetical protein